MISYQEILRFSDWQVSTIDQLFIIKQTLSIASEYNCNIYQIFIDFWQAYD